MRGRVLKTGIIVAGSLWLSACTSASSSPVSGTAPPAPGGEAAGAEAQTAQPVERREIPLRCEVSCSQTQLRTATVKLIWSNSQEIISASGMTPSMMAQPTIDTTVYKNGFQRNSYATFSNLDSSGGPQSAVPVSAAPGQRQRAYDLRLTEFNSPPPSLGSVAGQPQGSEAFVVIAGLEPGLNYTWRLRFPSGNGWFETQPVTCEAPVCPADIPQN